MDSSLKPLPAAEKLLTSSLTSWELFTLDQPLSPHHLFISVVSTIGFLAAVMTEVAFSGRGLRISLPSPCQADGNVFLTKIDPAVNPLLTCKRSTMGAKKVFRTVVPASLEPEAMQIIPSLPILLHSSLKKHLKL